MNKWNDRKDADLAATATAAAAKLSQTGMGVPVALKDELATAGLYLNNLIVSAKEARAAAIAATTLKAGGREETVAALNAVGAVLYGNPEISDYQLQSLGFAPRPSGPSPRKLPVTVTGVKVAFDKAGAPIVSFARGANRASTIFVIQASLDAGATWDVTASTLRTRETLPDLVPGAQVRVVATNSLGEAPPSGAATVGAAAAPSASLRVVAGGRAA